MKGNMNGGWGVSIVLRVVGVLFFAVALTGLAPSTFGQTIDGNIVGTVFDSTGAVVPDASVMAVNNATGAKSQTTTGANGIFRFNNLPVGIYNLTMKKTGFTDAVLQNLAVDLNKTTTANVVIKLGTVTTTVEVVDATPSIDTTTVQVQNTYQAEQIVALPIIENSASFFGAYNLSLLGAGVASNGGVGQGQGPSIGGQRPMNNNYMIEGVDNNNKAVTGPLVYVPTEATAEFSLLQNQFTAEFGHSSGGQFNMVVKSGSNQFHGSVYEYFQNRNLNAEDQKFTRQGFTYNPRFDQNKMGGSIGGPIKKDKLFFFGNFEYAPLGQAYSGVSALSPTAAGYALLDGLSSTFPNSATNYKFMKQYMPASTLPLGACRKPPVPPNLIGAPTGNCLTVGTTDIPIGTLPVAGAFFTNLWTTVASTDYNISDKDQFRARIIYNKQTGLDNSGQLPAFWTTLPQRYYLATLAEYHNFSPNVTNEFRVGYNRFTQYFVVGDIKFPGLDVLPNIDLDDLAVSLGPDGSAPQYLVQNTYQLVDNISWTKGKHTFKFGFDGRRAISPQHFIQRERGEYEYSNLTDYLTDQIPDGLAERNLGGGKITYYGNQWATYLYGQDSYRIRPNLTIDLGLRWERTSVPLSMGVFQVLNHVADAPGVLVFNAPKAANKNFAPKVGIAYSPGTSGNTSIRAGFGMAYDVIFDNVGSTAYPPQISATIDVDPAKPAPFKVPFLANGAIFPGSVATGGSLTQADARAATSSYIPDQVLPYSINWNASVQHVFHHDYTVELRYVGTRGVHLLVQNRMGQVSRVTPTRFLPTYLQDPGQAAKDALPVTLAQLQALPSNPTLGPLGFATSSGNIVWWPPIGDSSYHGMALQVTRRFNHGFQMVGSYTWSHAIDDATATHFTTVLTPRREQDFGNVGVDKSSSALDRRHRLTLSWMYDTPWFNHSDNWLKKNGIGNWTFVGTYTAESPEYVTVQSGVDSNLNGDSAGDRTIFNSSGVAGTGSSVSPICRSGAPFACTISGSHAAADAPFVVGYVANDPKAQYIKAQIGALATDGRNSLKTVGINNFDLSLGKKFIIREGKTLEFRGDFTNAFNHPQYTPGQISSIYYTQYNTGVRDYLIPGNARFGKWDQVFDSHSRTTQLALRFVF